MVFRGLLQDLRDNVPLNYVYSLQHSHKLLSRIDGMNATHMYWCHNKPNGTPERLTDAEGRVAATPYPAYKSYLTCGMQITAGTTGR